MKKILFFIGLTLSIFNFQFSFSQTPTWKNITPSGWSGTFQSVDWFSGNGLIAIANNGYFYKSVDTGKTWTPYSKPVASVTSISLYPDHKRAFICGDSHLYKTTDAAVSWQEIKYTGITSSYLGLSIDKIYIKTEDTLLAGVNDKINGAKIYLSPDKGNTWTLVGANLEGNSPLGSGINDFYFVNPSHGYALGNGFYAETINGGYSWTLSVIDFNIGFVSKLEIPNHRTIISIAKPQSDPLPPLDSVLFFEGGISKIVQVGTMLYGTYGKNFFSSADNGKTWTVKIVDANKTFNSITFLDQLTGIIVGDELTTYRTTDGGSTWTKYVHGGAEGIKHIYCKTKNECFISGETGRLFHTKDGGHTWDFKDLNKTALQQIVFPTKDTGYVSASGVIFRTIDGGINWTKFVQKTNGGFLNFITKDTGYVGFSGGTLSKTIDGGQTWNDAFDYTYIMNMGNGGAGACFKTTTEGLVSASNTLLYTNDGGNSWQVKGNGITASSITNVNKNWLLTTNDGKIYLCDKDVNCTITYNDSKDNYSIPVKRNDSTIYIAATNDSILISKDYGNTWQKYLDSVITGEFSFDDANNIYSINTLSTANAIYKGVFPTSNQISTFVQINNNSYKCIISNETNSNYTSTIELINSSNQITVLNVNMLIVSGTSFIINIPLSVQVGSGYKIRIVPNDTLSYSTVESSTFSILTGIEEKTIITPIIKVTDNTIYCDCENYSVFNTLGQQMQKGIELPTGIYIIKCEETIKKVIIKP
jgi:photosystem II stability/assembly factor-like uncharacterized protein